MEARGRFSDSGLPPSPPSRPVGQWHFGAGASPLTAAGPSRTCTGFPFRSPFEAAAYHPPVTTQRLLAAWFPVVAWAAVIFALSSVPSLSSGLGGWDLILRKGAHLTEYAILAVLLRRALGRDLPAFLVGVAYAASDELHQHFVRGAPRVPRGRRDRRGRARASACSPTGGTRRGEPARARARPRPRARRHAPAVATSGSRTRRGGCVSTGSTFRRIAARRRPSSTRALGNWQVLLERFAEDRAPVYFRPNADASAALRRLQAAGVSLGVFTDAPEPLARIALEHLGAARRLDAWEAGAGALERLLARLGPDTAVLRTRGGAPE